MGIRVFNTLTRQKEPLEPVQPGRIGMYVCGPTVYSYSHIGHMVGPVIYDSVKRYLQYSGFEVTMVVNITDVDDKIINQAAQEKTSVGELTRRVTEDYLASLARMGVSVDAFPRATDYIPAIQMLITTLIDKGFAYAAGGDVYFDVAKDPDYGKLTNRKVEELLAGTRKEVSDLKRSPADFALWKGAKPGEPAWESPWGSGRPGWHIECSAMSMALLGETFDIHGGGLDLCFPHHEDEIAQAESATGKPYAKYWMHNGLMQRRGDSDKIKLQEGDADAQETGKMGKSKRNAVVMKVLFEQHSAETLRFFLLNNHYRSPIDFGDDRLKETASALGRLQTLRERVERILKRPFGELAAAARRAEAAFPADSPFLKQVSELRDRFLEHMDDDFNTGAAVGVLFELLPTLNKFADDAKLETGAATEADRAAFTHAATVLRELTNLLGVLVAPSAPTAAADGLAGPLLDLLVDLRNQARKAKDFKLSDSIRDRLKALGVTIEDRAEGSGWKIGPPQ